VNDPPRRARSRALGLPALLPPFGRVAIVGGLSSLGALTGFAGVNLALPPRSSAVRHAGMIVDARIRVAASA
jgi:hypothetical protein